MNKNKITLMISLSLLAANAGATSRVDSMGGTGVVSSNYIESPFYNPANLSSFKSNDDFGILFSGNGLVNKNDDLIDKIDIAKDDFATFENSYNSLESLVSQGIADPYSIIGREAELLSLKNETVSNANLFADSIGSLNGETLDTLAGFKFSLAIPNKYISTAVFAQSSLSLVGLVEISPDDISNLRTFASDLDLIDYSTSIGIPSFNIDSDITSNAFVVGANIMDVGVAMAHKFEINENYNVSIGVTPKYQRVDLLAYRADVETFTDDNFTEDEYLVDDSNFNVDLGVNLDLFENWKISFVGKNLIENTYGNEFTFQNGSTYTAEYKISPQYKGGLSYSNSILTASVEADLNEDEMTKSKFLKAGLELNAFDWVQIRAGYKTDNEDIRSDLYTVGLGFSPFGTVAVDIVAMKSESTDIIEGQIGGGVTLSFKF